MIGTPFHLRRRVREALWRHGHLLPNTPFTRECREAYIPGWMVGRFLVEAPDTTTTTAAEISQKTGVPENFVGLIIHCLETSAVKREEDD